MPVAQLRSASHSAQLYENPRGALRRAAPAALRAPNAPVSATTDGVRGVDASAGPELADRMFQQVLTRVDEEDFPDDAELAYRAAAAEILFSARRYSAAEAAQMGLINRVVPVAELEAAVVDLATVVAGNAPMTIRSIKAAIREVGKDPDRRDLAHVAELTEACFASEDYREGQAAFLEKRTPVFHDR